MHRSSPQSGRVAPHKSTNVDHQSDSRIGSCPHPLRRAIHSVVVVPHDWPDSHETPSMTATSRPIVITRAKARALGIPLSELLGPGFTRLFHDTYVGSGQMITLRVRARTIMKRLPAATHVSHHTAVRLWGGVAPDSADIHVSMPSREARCRRAGVAAHLGAASAQTTTCDGVPISTPVQAFLDLASVGVNLVDLVIAGDSLVKANDLDPRQLRGDRRCVSGSQRQACPPGRLAGTCWCRLADGDTATAARRSRRPARTTGQRDRTHCRRQVALAIRPLLPRVQVDHRVRRASTRIRRRAVEQ